MPPSGYSSEQGAEIVAFLRSCSAALRREAEISGTMPVEALRAECRNIESLLLTGSEGRGLSRAVLELTLRFYEEMAGREPGDWPSFERVVAEVLESAFVAICAIHVPPNAAIASV